MSSPGKPLLLHQLWSPPTLHSLVEGLLDTTGPQDLSAITAQDWPLDISTPLTLMNTKLTHSLWSYEQYCQLVNEKFQENQITSDNIYNMDEKGFLMGRLIKTERISSQDLRGSGKLIGVSQDGSREWITIVAAICADSTTLPPLLIYQSDSGM
jgi:hypothetical protein